VTEYEPDDSRNVTGTASARDGHWTHRNGRPSTGVSEKSPARAKEAELHPDIEDERLTPGVNTSGTGLSGGARSKPLKLP
jgi:hypothetical protein